MKASCTESGAPFAERPSSVVTARPSTSARMNTQARASLPSTRTLQAPHSPRPQPYFGPFSERSLRRKESSGVDRGKLVMTVLPFTKIRMAALTVWDTLRTTWRAPLWRKTERHSRSGFTDCGARREQRHPGFGILDRVRTRMRAFFLLSIGVD